MAAHGPSRWRNGEADAEPGLAAPLGSGKRQRQQAHQDGGQHQRDLQTQLHGATQPTLFPRCPLSHPAAIAAFNELIFSDTQYDTVRYELAAAACGLPACVVACDTN